MFQAVMEATSGYERLFPLLEPWAPRVIPARSKKLRVIAESTPKSDELDAQDSAKFLALDMISSPTVVDLNGGVLRTFSSGRRRRRAMTPN